MENKELTLNEYQKRAMSTCMPSCDNFSYMFIGLVGELGELASKVAKDIRKEKVYIGDSKEEERNNLVYETALHYINIEKDLKAECGDICWFIAGLCHQFGWSLEEICQMNLDKLASRKARGVIEGNGDNR